MQKQPFLLVLSTGLILCGFVYGLVLLLHLRYNAGDVYPPYSSFRADPLGTKALYEGIRDVHELTAARSYTSVSKLRDQRDITLLYLGLHPNQFFWVEKEVVSALESLLLNGNRVILTFTPVHREVSTQDFWSVEETESDEEPEAENGEDTETSESEGAANDEDAGDTDLSEPDNAAPDETPDETEKTESFADMLKFAVDLPEKWGVEFGYTPLTLNDDNVYESIRAIQVLNETLPKTLSWHTALYFEPHADKQWNTIYEAGGQPVIIERRFGDGTLVLCADSYFVSNEALQVERHSELLAWMLGAQATIVFDETHLGVMENPGIATLIRKYRLMWFVGGLIALALLFVWKNIVSFVPPADDAVTANHERAGKDSLGGLINLLRQNIPSRKILPACVAEWEKSVSHRKKELDSAIEDIRAVAEADTARPAREQNPVESYRKMCQVLDKQR